MVNFKKHLKKEKEKMVTEVTTAKDETAQVPATIDFAADAGQGLELTDSKSFAIPFLLLLQGQSPQLETVDGARPGKFFNNITNELWDKVVVVPCMFKREYIRWAPRSEGGGFKGMYDAQKVDKKEIPNLTVIGNHTYIDVPDGTDPTDDEGKPLYDELSDTRQHYVLVLSKTGQWMPALLSMKSTQITKSRRWVSLMDGIKVPGANGPVTPASYSHMYELNAVKQDNPEGTWWGLEAKLLGQVSDPFLYKSAKAFHAQIKAGLVETAPPTDATS